MDLLLIVFYLTYFYQITISQKDNVQDKMFSCQFHAGFKLKGEISSINTDRGDIYWSPCYLNTSKQICPQDSIVCLKDLNHPDHTITNLGKSFSLTLKDNGKYYLISQEAARCKSDPNRNYTVYILFEEYAIEPYLIQSDDPCLFRIGVPNPKIEYPCTILVDGFLLDFRKLTDDWEVNVGDKKYIFNLCRPAIKCYDSNVASCVTSTLGKSVLGDVSTRRITYENDIVQFHFYNGNGKDRVNIKIDLQCNWDKLYGNAWNLTNFTSKKLSKFAVESKLGCVKLPMNCRLTDIEENLEYDISPLYNERNAWTVRNVFNKTIRINVCGPLNSPIEECTDRESQICGKILSDTYLSYGSILVDKHIEKDTFKAKFIYGSVCPKNSLYTLSSELTWKCSAAEKGPELVNVKECSIEIVWETPHACPKRIITSSTLSMHDHLGHRNLTSLCGEDRLHRLNSTSYIRFNLCAPLIEACGGWTNVSACLHQGKMQVVLGFYKEDKLISRNGVVSMELIGAPCTKLNLTFSCDYTAPITGIFSVHILRDNCVYDMHVRTPRICAAKQNSKSAGDCVIEDNDMVYNLTNLALTYGNYRLTTEEEDVEYLMNVCYPVVTGPSALCKVNSALCLYNRTEANFKRRFFTIGYYPGKFTIEDGNLTVEFANGDMCRNRRFASAKIYFICSEGHDPEPVLTSIREDCFYEFVWRTKRSCPMKKILEGPPPCVFAVGTEFLNLTSVEKKEFQIPYGHEATITFNICQENCTKINNVNGNRETIPVRRKVDSKSIEFLVNNRCADVNWNKLKIVFDCKVSNEEVFRLISIENCTAYVKCYSKVFCKEQHFESLDERLERLMDITLYHFTNERSQIPTNKSTSTEIKPAESNNAKDMKDELSRIPVTIRPIIQRTTDICIIKIGSKEIRLNDLIPVTMLSPAGNRYSIGLNSVSGSENHCADYICKGNVTIASLNSCPNVTAKGNDGGVNAYFNYTLPSKRSYLATLVLQCNQTETKPEIVEETNSSLTLIYPLEDVCLPSPPSKAGWIIGSAILLVIIAVITIGGYFYKRRGYLLLSKENKSDLCIYMRDAQA